VDYDLCGMVVASVRRYDLGLEKECLRP